MVPKSLHWTLLLAAGVSACGWNTNPVWGQTIKSAQLVKTAIKSNDSSLVAVEALESQVQPNSLAAPLSATAQDPPQVVLQTLGGHEVACQAACCWPLAKLLEQRATTILVDSQRCGSSDDSVASLQASFLRRQAQHQRDLAAANALRAYYSWIANSQQLSIVSAGLQLQQEQVSVQKALINKGVAIPDPTALERQRLELIDKQLQLQAADRQLASGLLRLTCCQSDLQNASTEGLDIQPQPIDCEALRCYSLEHRHDLLALQHLCHCIDEKTVREVANMLTPLMSMGLGLPALGPIEKLSAAFHSDELLRRVRAELGLAIHALRSRIEQDVCDKCLALTTAYQRVTLAEDIIATWNERISALERLEQLGDARGQELNMAKAELLNARSTLITRKLSAKLAEVDLAEAVGHLAYRCCQGQPWLVR